MKNVNPTYLSVGLLFVCIIINILIFRRSKKKQANKITNTDFEDQSTYSIDVKRGLVSFKKAFLYLFLISSITLIVVVCIRYNYLFYSNKGILMAVLVVLLPSLMFSFTASMMLNFTQIKSGQFIWDKKMKIFSYKNSKKSIDIFLDSEFTIKAFYYRPRYGGYVLIFKIQQGKNYIYFTCGAPLNFDIYKKEYKIKYRFIHFSVPELYIHDYSSFNRLSDGIWYLFEQHKKQQPEMYK